MSNEPMNISNDNSSAGKTALYKALALAVIGAFVLGVVVGNLTA